MEIILLKNIKNLGKIGNIIIVKSGYARNYLIPSGLALSSTFKNINIITKKTNIFKKQTKLKISQSKFKIRQIQSIFPIKIYSQSGARERLFGSIGPQDIAIAIMKLGIQINKSEIYLKNNFIRKLGVYKVVFRPYKKIGINFLVHILSKNHI
ncbi:50S ribosomal protein L9 [Buchnera aphidicola (Phyllaphis fagi)]|uniref:50S ribosomal protein L9 n=1 Tax=Buchnera aphidicola TaxID=9 RepID=UPI0034649E01